MAKSGIRIDMDFADLAVNKYQIITKSGAWYSILDPATKEALIDETGKAVRVQGMAKVLDYLQLNPDYFKKLQDVIMTDIEGTPIVDNSEAADE